jgi:muramoyltetrapeptide carboxypeptidase LdcA involved in peptidoglycan recycling
MVMITPEKLKVGDEIRVIAPSRGLKILSQETIDTSLSRLTELGFKVTFGRNVNNFDEFMSSTISDRVSDLHEAFSDKNVKAILTVIGGFNSNQILDYIDYELIKNNPKIICGYSDITTLLTAFNTKSNLVTYYGPHFSSFGMKKGFDYSLEYFKKMLIENTEFELNSSSDWSDDLWFLDQENREFIPNEGMYCINEGTAEGSTTGGNISTFSLLSGTQYFPSLDDKIIILEAHGEVKEHHFDRLLQQLIQQDNFSKAKGLVIGMFQKECKINRDKLLKIIKNKRELDNIPVIANANFGHTTPIATLPLGGKIEIISSTTNCKIKIKV